MNNFYDENTDLDWYEFDKPEDLENYAEVKSSVNGWKSEGISKFILDETGILDDFMSVFLPDFIVGNSKHAHCYCYYVLDKNKKPLGITNISTNDESENVAYIEYLIVNPKNTGKGIGTRMIKSIISNPEFFAKTKKVFHWELSVDDRNEPSKRAVLKNNFRVYSKPKNPDTTYVGTLSTYYWAKPRKLPNNSNSEMENN